MRASGLLSLKCLGVYALLSSVLYCENGLAYTLKAVHEEMTNAQLAPDSHRVILLMT